MTPPGDPFNELAELFLTEADEPRVAAPTAVELLLVGNLPVRAALWLPPYADARARVTGTTALVRLDDDVPALQVLRGGSPPSRRERLEDVIAELGDRVTTWIVRPPLATTAAAMVEAGAGTITVLSSANEGAIVKAYQEIKGLVAASLGLGVELPAIALAVVGADRGRAGQFQEKLERVSRSFLHVDLPLVTCLPRMDAGIRASEVVTFPADAGAGLETVLGWIGDATPAGAPLEPGDAAPPRRGPAVKLAPKPSVELEPKEPARSVEPDRGGLPRLLAGYIDGVDALDVRCPGHEHLELGVDAAGRLHVIARDTHLRELHVVESWARDHRELIERACSGRSIDPGGRSVLHVFTDTPATLADLQGCNLRLHVLAPVDDGQRRSWYYAPLNG